MYTEKKSYKSFEAEACALKIASSDTVLRSRPANWNTRIG